MWVHGWWGEVPPPKKKERKIKSFVDNLFSCCCHYKFYAFSSTPWLALWLPCKLFGQIIWYAKHFRQILILEICFKNKTTRQRNRNGNRNWNAREGAQPTRHCSSFHVVVVALDDTKSHGIVLGFLGGSGVVAKSHTDVIKRLPRPRKTPAARFPAAFVCMNIDCNVFAGTWCVPHAAGFAASCSLSSFPFLLWPKVGAALN